MTDRAPDSLRAAIGAGVRVTPLPSPARRATRRLVPAALIVLALVLAIWGLRADYDAVGPWRLWLASLAQVAVAIAVARVALAESIPGQRPPVRTHIAMAAVAVFFVVALTEATFAASRTFVPAAWTSRFFWICFTHPVALGLPVLVLLAVMLRRGLISRPALAGALAGLAAGLVSDAGWRLYCHVSDPAHVLVAHAGAVLALSTAGMGAGYFFRKGSTS